MLDTICQPEVVTVPAEIEKSESVVKRVIYHIIDQVCNNQPSVDSSEVKADSTLDSVGGDQANSNPVSESKSSKRKRSLMSAAFLHAEKRRSTRVKTTVKPVVEKVTRDTIKNLKELLPSSLLTAVTSEQQTTKSESHDSVAAESHPMFDLYMDAGIDAKTFLQTWRSNQGVLQLMGAWLDVMVNNRQYRWSRDLVSTYVGMFEIIRDCVQAPNLFGSEKVEDMAMYTLLWMEVKVDRMCSANAIDGESIGRQFREDICYWDMILGSQRHLPNHWVEYTARFEWMAAKYYSTLLNSERSLHIYLHLKDFLESNEVTSIQLPNCTSDCCVTPDMVEEQIHALERAHSLEALHDCIQAGNNRKVIDLLVPTFQLPLSKQNPDLRIVHLTHLRMALRNLCDKDSDGESEAWMSLALFEALHHLKSTTSKKGDWLSLVNGYLHMMLDSFSTIKPVGAPFQNSTSLTKHCLVIVKEVTTAETPGIFTLETAVLAYIILSKLADRVTDPELSEQGNTTPTTLPPSAKSVDYPLLSCDTQ